MSLGDIRNLDYTILLCSKLQETRQFYLDIMGFPLAHDSEHWVSFQVGSALLTLKPRGPGVAWDDGPIAPGSAAVQLAFRVAPHQIDSCYATLQSKGVTILSPPRDIPGWRHRALFFRDPEDNVIEIYAEV
jgi:glyoxylase I family protein